MGAEGGRWRVGAYARATGGGAPGRWAYDTERWAGATLRLDERCERFGPEVRGQVEQDVQARRQARRLRRRRGPIRGVSGRTVAISSGKGCLSRRRISRGGMTRARAGRGRSTRSVTGAGDLVLTCVVRRVRRRQGLASARVWYHGLATPQPTCDLLIAAGRQAIDEDFAESLILGCTLETGCYKEMEAELGVPVIDPSIAAFKAAEHADLSGSETEPRVIGMPPGVAVGENRDAERSGVGAHMPAVGRQGHGVENQASTNLHKHRKKGKNQNHKHASFTVLVRVQKIVVVKIAAGHIKRFPEVGSRG